MSTPLKVKKFHISKKRDLSLLLVQRKVASHISHYAMIYYQNGFILFGGLADVKTIARLDFATSNWTKLGDLNTGRDRHGVIYDDQVFLVIGGFGNYKTEKCSLSGTSFESKY